MNPTEAAKPPSASAPAASVTPAEPTDRELIASVLSGETQKFEMLIARYQPRIFGVVRRYARRETEVQDIVQEIFLKTFQKLDTFRADAPFEHWLMRLAVRTCYDFLRQHQRNREYNVTDLSDPEGESDVLERSAADPKPTDRSEAAKELVQAVLAELSPPARMVITLLEIEEHSIKEIAKLTGWSETLVKVRAFRARAEMKKVLAKFPVEKYL